MTNEQIITDVAAYANKYVKAEKGPFSRITKIRNNNTKPFTERTVNKADKYAFNWGGRSEIQFNFGFESWKDGSIFRAGIAISLQRSQGLTDPVNTLGPWIEVFNDYISRNPEKFSDMTMWVHHRDGGSFYEGPINPGLIPINFIKEGFFIFIGFYKRKTDIEIPQIPKWAVECFNSLIVPYEDIYNAASQKIHNKDYEKQQLLTRICWNDFGWQAPSGREGKSPNHRSYEARTGYGHEEWLFSYDSLHNGFQYAYLHSVEGSSLVSVDSEFDLHLYAIDSRNKKRFYIGVIYNVQLLAEKERDRAFSVFGESGLLEKRESELAEVGARPEAFKEWVKNSSLFNIRFDPENVEAYPETPIQMEDEEWPASDYYNLKRSPSGLGQEYSGEIRFSGAKKKDTRKQPRNVKGKTIQSSQFHNKLQNKFKAWLESASPDSAIDLETFTGSGTRADLASVDNQGGVTFYEVKVYPSARQCIREAVGQLLEYGFYPGKKKADSLVIVSQARLTKSDRKYINMLAEFFNIPLDYWQFSIKENQVIDSILWESSDVP